MFDLRRILGIDSPAPKAKPNPVRPAVAKNTRGTALQKQAPDSWNPSAADAMIAPGQQLQVRPQAQQSAALNLGIGSMPIQGVESLPLQTGMQGGTFNPGFTPLQRQKRPVQNPGFNPQNLDRGYYWN